jgi:hypothetical protein
VATRALVIVHVFESPRASVTSPSGGLRTRPRL